MTTPDNLPPLPALNPGERNSGLAMAADGTPSHHLILLPGAANDITWPDALEWAKSAGGRQVNGKYDHLFEQLKVGSCIVCEFQERESMRNALVKWLRRKGKAEELTAYSVSKCADGKARVWLTRK